MDFKLQRVNAIAHVAQAWLSSSSSWMRRAKKEISKKSSYSPEMVEACLKKTFEGYHEDALREWICRNLPQNKKTIPFQRVLILLPSTVFAAAWQAATAVWLANGYVVFKPSRREPIFASLLAESIRSTAGDLLPVKVLNPNRRIQLKGYFDKIIAYGQDETIQGFRTELKSKRQSSLIGFGSMISLAYVGCSAFAEQSVTKLIQQAAFDIVLYDTQGCLSPQCFYIEKNQIVSPEKFAAKLAKFIQEMDFYLPRKHDLEDAWSGESFWQHWKFRESQGHAQIFGRHVVLHHEPGFNSCGLRRVVFVKPIRNLTELLKDCHRSLFKISTVAVSDPKSLVRLKQALRSYKKIRFCQFGQMHQPEPGWRNGGINLLRELLS